MFPIKRIFTDLTDTDCSHEIRAIRISQIRDDP